MPAQKKPPKPVEEFILPPPRLEGEATTEPLPLIADSKKEDRQDEQRAQQEKAKKSKFKEEKEQELKTNFDDETNWNYLFMN